MLVKFVKEKKDSWEHFLDTCVFAYNTARHESTHYSPFELMFGRKAVLPIELDNKHPEDILEEFEQAPDLSPSQVDYSRNLNQQ